VEEIENGDGGLLLGGGIAKGEPMVGNGFQPSQGWVEKVLQKNRAQPSLELGIGSVNFFLFLGGGRRHPKEIAEINAHAFFLSDSISP
jgi:hypothetical protein